MNGRPQLVSFTSSLPLRFRTRNPPTSSSLCTCTSPSPSPSLPPALPPALLPSTALPSHASVTISLLSDEQSSDTTDTTEVAPASSSSSLSITEHIAPPRNFSSSPEPTSDAASSISEIPHVDPSTSIFKSTSSSDENHTRKRPRQSLPGRSERRYLSECTQMTRGRSYPAVRSLSFTLNCRELCGVPSWAYTAHIRAAKTVLGKRAVLRNRGKRRLRAAASRVLPNHAVRQREYAFSVSPESLTTSLPALILEITSALKATNSFVEELPYELMRRRRRPPPDPPATPPSSST